MTDKEEINEKTMEIFDDLVKSNKKFKKNVSDNLGRLNEALSMLGILDIVHGGRCDDNIMSIVKKVDKMKGDFAEFIDDINSDMMVCKKVIEKDKGKPMLSDDDNDKLNLLFEDKE